jgi:hypothetical protein
MFHFADINLESYNACVISKQIVCLDSTEVRVNCIVRKYLHTTTQINKMGRRYCRRPKNQTTSELRLVFQFHMISLQTLRTGDLFEIDLVSGLEDAVTFALNGRIVNENFFTALRFNKSVAFFG